MSKVLDLETGAMLRKVIEMDSAATAGPWSAAGAGVRSALTACLTAIAESGGYATALTERLRNAEAIAVFRNTAPRMARALRSVADLHTEQEARCSHCHTLWPCDTMYVVQSALDGSS